MVVKIKSEEDLQAFATEALHLLRNLRYFEQLWSERYGQTRIQRDKWRERTDAFLEKYEAKKDPGNHNPKEIDKIEIA